MGPVSSFFIDSDEEFIGTETPLEFRECVGDESYPFEIITQLEDGRVAGLDLTLVDTIKLYTRLDTFLKNTFGEGK